MIAGEGPMRPALPGLWTPQPMGAAAPVLKDVFATPAFSQSSAGVGWLKD